MNCISATGRMPVTALPTAVPRSRSPRSGCHARAPAELLDEPLCHAERAAVDADVFAEQVDSIIRLQRLAHGLPQRLGVAQLARAGFRIDGSGRAVGVFDPLGQDPLRRSQHSGSSSYTSS